MASKEELKQILRELRSGGDSERQPQGGALPRRSPCQAIASPSEVGGTDAQAGGVRDSATSHPPRARIVRPVVDLGAVTEIAHLLDFMKGERL